MNVYKDKNGKWYAEIEREVTVYSRSGEASFETNVVLEFSEDELRDMIDWIQEAQAKEKEAN